MKNAPVAASTPPQDGLHLLLQELAPNAEAASEALERIVEAIGDYNSSKPYRDEHGVRRRGSVSKTRKSLADLEQVLAEAASAVQELRLEAIPLFCRAYGGPRGGLVQLLRRARSAASEAGRRAQELPDKPPDLPRHLLALDVARVFVEVLKKEPKKTRDEIGKVTYARGGAAYARVLRLTFAIAGLKSKEIGPDIDAGLRLLQEISGSDSLGPD